MQAAKPLCDIVKEYAPKLALPESVFGYMLEVISEELPTVFFINFIIFFDRIHVN